MWTNLLCRLDASCSVTLILSDTQWQSDARIRATFSGGILTVFADKFQSKPMYHCVVDRGCSCSRLHGTPIAVVRLMKSASIQEHSGRRMTRKLSTHFTNGPKPAAI